MKRSHSRHSYPYDKALPKAVAHNGVPGFEPTPAQRRVNKDMHHSKQRQHDKDVAETELQELQIEEP